VGFYGATWCNKQKSIPLWLHRVGAMKIKVALSSNQQAKRGALNIAGFKPGAQQALPSRLASFGSKDKMQTPSQF